MAANHIDFLFVTETFFSSTIPDSLCTNETFACLRSDRSDSHPKKRGGGTAVFYKKSIDLSPVQISPTDYLKHFCEVLVCDHRPSKTRIILVYRPPSTSASQTLELFKSLTALLDISDYHFVILGDFNFPAIHWLPDLLPDSPEFLVDWMTSFHLSQLVTFPTRTSRLGKKKIPRSTFLLQH
uniref:ATP-dependent DNA helicase n=1 Tax=Caenorhabditis japonica TaxID=281687 RepID=A0A8R1ES57_CAEJA